MADLWQFQTNMNRGELDPQLTGRVDLAAYYNGLKTALNVLTIPQGGVKKRPGMEYLADHADFETFFDVTHSVQKIDGDMVHTLKDYPWQYAPGLLRAASALGIGNFFMEVHPEPTNSASDKYNMIRLDHFEHIVNDIVRFNYTHE